MYDIHTILTEDPSAFTLAKMYFDQNVLVYCTEAGRQVDQLRPL